MKQSCAFSPEFGAFMLDYPQLGSQTPLIEAPGIGDVAAVEPALSSYLLITMFGGSKTSSRLVWIIFLYASNFNFYELLRDHFYHLVFQWNKNYSVTMSL